MDALFSEGKFPTVEDLVGGTIIQGSWTEQYKNAETLLRDQKLLLEELFICNTYVDNAHAIEDL